MAEWDDYCRWRTGKLHVDANRVLGFIIGKDLIFLAGNANANRSNRGRQCGRDKQEEVTISLLQ